LDIHRHSLVLVDSRLHLSFCHIWLWANCKESFISHFKKQFQIAKYFNQVKNSFRILKTNSLIRVFINSLKGLIWLKMKWVTKGRMMNSRESCMSSQLNLMSKENSLNSFKRKILQFRLKMLTWGLKWSTWRLKSSTCRLKMATCRLKSSTCGSKMTISKKISSHQRKQSLSSWRDFQPWKKNYKIESNITF
jgi:hypothetical protein